MEPQPRFLARAPWHFRAGDAPQRDRTLALRAPAWLMHSGEGGCEVRTPNGGLAAIRGFGWNGDDH